MEFPYLFIVLDDEVTVYLLHSVGGSELSIGSSVFHCLSSRNGFYDFLRNLRMEIVGVRFSAFKHEPIFDHAMPLSYTYVNVRRSYMEIYFGDTRDRLATEIADQAFGDDAFWRTNEGTYALQVGTNDLSSAEFQSLKRFAREVV
jgi:hypothetical protein